MSDHVYPKWLDRLLASVIAACRAAVTSAVSSRSMPADLPVAAPDPASRLAEWADDAAHIVQSVRSHEPTYPNPAALRRDVRALLAERQQDKERIERLETALVTAALPLEVLRGQIAVKPYRELTAELQQQIVEATDAIRAALAVEEDAEND